MVFYFVKIATVRQQLVLESHMKSLYHSWEPQIDSKPFVVPQLDSETFKEPQLDSEPQKNEKHCGSRQ